MKVVFHIVLELNHLHNYGSNFLYDHNLHYVLITNAGVVILIITIDKVSSYFHYSSTSYY
jgi:hypothetical protein